MLTLTTKISNPKKRPQKVNEQIGNADPATNAKRQMGASARGRQMNGANSNNDDGRAPPPKLDFIDLSEDSPQELPPPKLQVLTKQIVKPDRFFPRFDTADVIIQLAVEKKHYNYQLHSNVLINASEWFEKTLCVDMDALEPDSARAAHFRNRYHILARYELGYDPNVHDQAQVLERTTLTHAKLLGQRKPKPLTSIPAKDLPAYVGHGISLPAQQSLPSDDEVVLVAQTKEANVAEKEHGNIGDIKTVVQRDPAHWGNNVSAPVLDVAMTDMDNLDEIPIQKKEPPTLVSTTTGEPVMKGETSLSLVVTKISQEEETTIGSAVAEESVVDGEKFPSPIPEQGMKEEISDTASASTSEDKSASQASAVIEESVAPKEESPILITARTEEPSNKIETVPGPGTEDVIMADTISTPINNAANKPVLKEKKLPTITSAVAEEQATNGEPSLGLGSTITEKQPFGGIESSIQAIIQTADPKVVPDKKPSDETLQAYDNLFRAYYNLPLVMETRDISIALRQAEHLINVARLYASIPLVRPHINNALLQYSRSLFEAIMEDPPRWIRLATYLESAPILREGIIHIVGNHPLWPWSSFTTNDLAPQVLRIIGKKIDDLKALKVETQKSLFVNSIQFNNIEVSLSSLSKATFDTWSVVQQWRDWFIGSVVEANRRSKEVNKCVLATVYRTLQKGGDAYLPTRIVLDRLRATKPKGQAFGEDKQLEIEQGLKFMKDFAQMTVQPLCVNNSMLSVEDAGIEYFTCTKIEDDELPWAIPEGG